jgi:alanine-glyoxylate transaminase/serine-glyoxylate transaminase/serine-pyruvate transaminase
MSVASVPTVSVKKSPNDAVESAAPRHSVRIEPGHSLIQNAENPAANHHFFCCIARYNQVRAMLRDGWEIDAVYSGTQKCLGVPPGLSPVSFSARAVDRVKTRARTPQSWYLDLGLLADYVGTARRYHHTAPISMLYALHAGLGVLLDEGLEQSWARHRHVGGLLQDSLTELGFRAFAQERRLPQLTSVWLPDGVDDAKVRAELRVRFDIEVGSGLGEFAGKGWRIGLMGHGARERSVVALLGALRALL